MIEINGIKIHGFEQMTTAEVMPPDPHAIQRAADAIFAD